MPKSYADALIAKKKKKEQEQKAVAKKPQSSSVSNVSKGSTFLGGGAAVKNVEKMNGPSQAKLEQINSRRNQTTSKPRERVASTAREMSANRRTDHSTAAQRQKMGMQTDADIENARLRRQELGRRVTNSVRKAMSEDNRGFAQRQKSGILTAEDQKRVEETSANRRRIASNTGAAAWKAIQDTGTGYAKTLADVDEMAKSSRKWSEAKSMKMGIAKDDAASRARIEEERQQSLKQARELRLGLAEKQEKRQAEWDAKTKGVKGLEKAWYGAVESGTGMLADTAVGALTGTGQFGALASMGLRTYGTTRGQAEKEGATEKEDRLYSLLQAGKEVGTELMFQGAGIARKAYSGGGKIGLSLADKAADVLTRGLTGKKADVAHAAIRLLAGTGEENIEELAGWGVDPLIKEFAYGKNVRQRTAASLRANLPEVKDEADAEKVASYFSTSKFTDDLTNEYVKSGMTKDEAAELAAEMRDYYVAYYAGDTEAFDRIEDDLARKLSGQSGLSKESWSMDELKDTFASTSLLTLATGLPGAASTSIKGNQIFEAPEVKAAFGDNAVRLIADAVQNVSDAEMSVKAQAMKGRLDSGKDLTGTQKYDLYKGYVEKVRETAKKAETSEGVVNKARRDQNLVQNIGIDENGNRVYAKETQRQFDEKYESTAATAEALRKFMESDKSISDDEIRRTDAAIKAVSDLHVGGLTVGDAHEFAYGNTLARETLKAEEGIDLDQYVVRYADGTVDYAATNEATEKALFEINARNGIETAKAETDVFIDDTRGEIDKDIMSRFGTNGQAVWKEINKDVDPRNINEYLTTANAAEYFYAAGRNTDMSVDEAVERYGSTFRNVDNAVLKRAFAAGARDRIIANTPGYGQTVAMGSNIALKKTEPITTGALIMDDDVVIPDSDQDAYKALAMATNANIHIVSELTAKGKDGKPIIDQRTGLPVQLNGMSHGNDIYLNVNASAEQNLGYVFMHEMTHQIKQYAPNEYLALENLVRDKWFNKDHAGMQKAIKDRIDLYARKGNQKLTEEEALEEIIADAMAEAIDDPNFAAEVCEQDVNLGQAILNSIKAALRSIREIFASRDVMNDRFHNSLLSYLGILDEAESMWLNALAVAKQNKADGLIADWQDRANKQNAPRLSVGEEKYSITTDKEDFIKGANLSKELRDWSKEIGLDKLSKQPIKGPVIVSVRDLRTAWYEKNGRADEAKVINTALDKIGDSLTQLVGKYQYIDLGDALNAAVTYRTDAEGHPTSVILSCQVKNAEYEVNFDFTTICAKRLAMQKILERFIKTEGERQGTTLYDELKLDEEGLYKLRLILETAGFEVSCRGCFVEQNRYSQQNQARTIANDWNKAIDEWEKENNSKVTENFDLVNMDINALDYDEIQEAFNNYTDLMSGRDTNVETKNRTLIEAHPFFRKRMNPSDYASMAGQRALMAIGVKQFRTKDGKTKKGTTLYGLLKRGQSDSKQSVPFTAYNGEISLLPDNMKGKPLYDYLLSIGGARAQSASDFQIEFVYDYMQMVADLSARGLPMHMYTKVIELAELFGMTGIKINLSAMCDVAENVGGEYAGLKLVDGKYEYNISDQSIDYKKAVDLQKREGYSKNIGIIMVALSSQHMLKSLDDPDVRYIIGYHSSAMPVVVANMSNMGGATDYTKINKTNKLNEKGQALFNEAMSEAKGKTKLEKYKDALRILDEKIQEETAKKKKKPRRGNEYGAYMSAYGNNTADFNTYDSLLETKDARKTADKYLEHCMENGLIPIYFPFAFHENYYKCEVYDFNMYDNNTGEYAPMESVQNIYPGLNMAAGETDTTAFTERVSQIMDEQNRVNKALDSQYDAVFDEAKKELKYSITGDDYMDIDASGIDHSELVHRVDAVKTEAQMRDDAYMSAVNSGNMDEAQRLVDEAARMAMPNTKLKGRWYHGTENEFTEFNFSQGGKNGTADGFGIYLTNDPEVASSYGNRMIEGYVNVERPASALTTATLTKPELHRLIRRTVEIEAETLQYDGYDSLEDAKRDTWISNYVNTYSAKNLEDAIADVTDAILQFNGNDMDIIQEIMVGMGIRDYDSAMDFYDMLTEETGIDGFETKWGDESAMADPNTPTIALAFRSNQIKSADTVTYAEDGSVIPLSERFDPSNNDIRYSMPTQDSDGNILTDGQMEYFKNSQARDAEGKLVPVYHTTITGGFTVFDPSYSDDHRSLFFTPDRRMSESYSRKDGQPTTDINPYKPNSNIKLITNVYTLPDFNDEEVVQRVRDRISNIEVQSFDGKTIAVGDDFVEVAKKMLPIMVENGYDDSDVIDELESESQTADPMGAAWEVYNNAWEYDLRYFMDFADMVGTYTCYLNLENPLVVNASGANWSHIPFEGGTYDTRDISAIAFGRGYDGVIIKTVVDYSDYNYGDDAADVYIAFSSNQVKDVNNENPTENPDIRYSMPTDDDVMNFAQTNAESTDDLWANDPVIAEGRIRRKKSKKDFINGKINEWNPAWKTEGKILKESAVQKDIKAVIMGAMRNSTTNAKYRQQLVDETMLVARKAYNMMKNDEYAKAADMLYDHAHHIIDNLEFFGNADKSEFQKYKDFRDYLRHTRITVPEDRRNAIDYAAYRKRNFGIILLGDNGIAPDKLWDDLHDEWPELFTEDIKGDIPSIMIQLENAVETYKPLAQAYTSEQCEEFAGDIADTLYDIIYQGEDYKSLADRYDNKAKAMKARHGEAMAKVKEQYKEKLLKQKLDAKRREYAKLEAQKEKLTSKYEKKIVNLKEKNDRAIKALKKKTDFEIATLKQNREYNIKRLQAEKRRAVEEAKQEARWKREEQEAERKARQVHRQLYDRVLKEYSTLTDMLLTPSKDRTKNIPEQLRQPLAEMLAVFDLEKERSKKLEEKYRIPTRAQLNFRQIKDALEKVAKEEAAETEFDAYLKYIGDKIEAIADKMDMLDDHSIDALDSSDIETIEDMLTGLIASIKNWHQLVIDGQSYQAQQKCDEIGEGAVEHQKMYGNAKKYGGTRQFLNNIVNMGELTPIYFFRQIKGLYDMYRQLRKGFDNYVENEKAVIDKISDILSPYYKTNRKNKRTKPLLSSGSTIEDWRHSESAETFDLTYGTITLTIAQRMSLYCLAKREGARSHIYSDNGGIVASEITAGSKIHKAQEMLKGKEIQTEQLSLTPADVDTIIASLTEEQVHVADQLQNLMSNEMAEIGNKASMQLIGIRMYKEKDYFPIKVQGDSRGTNLDQIGMREKVRNPGFSNPLKDNATNPIIIDDIFTVVASHCNEMNMYAAYAVPLTNFMKVYNGSVLNEKGKPVKIKAVIRQTYGDKAINYIDNFLNDINGNSFKRGGGLDDVLDKALGQAKKAAVFANLRVLLQQPTAIVRTFAVMNPKYVLAILKPEKGVIEEMLEHCPIAQWKNWGYYDTHFGRDIEDVMMGNNTETKVSLIMSDVYGKADIVTWGGIWQMIKAEIEDTHKDVKKGSDEYWKLCSERASYVFDTTQVVDSPFHRSNDMRSKNGLVKQLTSFQAEPTLSFNVLRQVFVDAIEAGKKGDEGKAVQILAKGALVWFGQAGLVALAQTVVDALRRKGHKDDDDDEDLALTWYQEWLKYFKNNYSANFWDDANPINNVYYFKEIIPPILDALAGKYVFDRQDLTFQWVDSLKTGIELCKKKWEKGEACSKTWYDCISELLGSVGYGFGIPIKTMSRGVKNAFYWWNKITGVAVFAEDGKAVDKAVDEFVDRFRKDNDESEGGSLMDSVAGKLGYRPADKSKQTSEGSDTKSEKPEGTEKRPSDSISDVSEHVSEGVANFEAEMAKRSNKAGEKAEGLSGKERDGALWDVICEGYTSSVASGNMAVIWAMREAFEENGGDVDWFDAKITDAMKSQYKKTINSDPSTSPGSSLRQETMRNYMTEHGVTDAEISDMCYHTYTARDLKAALRMGNEEYIMDELIPLIRAGLTLEDFEKIYKNRNRGANKYDGKYADDKYKASTGTYVWPTQGTITSYFGYRDAPTAGASSNHPAIDIGAPQGTPVVAADGGVVISAGDAGGYGNQVAIKHDDGTITYYSHLYSWNCKVGDQVSQGQQIAQVGSTGISTGPHLDFKVEVNGEPVDPLTYLNEKVS